LFKINWWKPLSGSVKISGSKNAALPILGAALLVNGKVTLHGMPKIGDVMTFLEIMKDVWVQYTFEWNTLHFDASDLKKDNLDIEKLKKIRASIFLLAPLLHFFGSISMPLPGGCVIGKRPVDDHINGLKRIGYSATMKEESIELDGSVEAWDRTINAGFSVSGTENLLVANVLRKGTTTIELAAIEPHVMNLIDFLRAAGANIKIRYNHTIIVEWVDSLSDGFEFTVVPDYIQSGTYMVIAALASEEYLDIENARIEDLYVYIEKLKEAGVKVEDLWNDTLRVFKANELNAVKVQTNVFPGFPTDLQSPFGVLMTQAEWTNKLHEVMFENRLNFLFELEKMRANVAMLNPHEALIFGKKQLKWGVTVTSWDLRAGAAMVIAGLIAEGATTVTNVEYIHRGYEDFVETLKSLGADIEEITE